MKKAAFFLALIISVKLYGQNLPVDNILPTAETVVHDPVLIESANRYYIFCTGNGISVWSSDNLKEWKKEPPVFDKAPEWALKAVPGFKGHIWAPDISYHNGLYYLYYSVSAFGKNTSCIGVATNKTLDRSSPDFRWTDHGKLIQSVPGRDNWNAIDPNLITDSSGNPWLVFGSFWSGIKMTRLADSLTSLSSPEQWYALATRRARVPADATTSDNAIEAPFVFKKDSFYYLFVSIDYCCRGAESTYKVIVGRSHSVTGPYLDRDGKSMMDAGGTLLIEGNSKWHGVGHSATVEINGQDYLVFHGYDAADKGRSKLRIEQISWQEGWPVIESK